MTYQKNIKSTFRGLTLIIFCLFSVQIYSQCVTGPNAGTDGSDIVCEKDEDDGSMSYSKRNYDLNTILGTKTPGGRWSTNDPANFFALDRNTGIVDLWQIKNSGEHEFTYTVTCTDGSTDSAIATIFLGGYPGEDNISGNADACGDDPNVNLFSFIGSDVADLAQDFNGIWTVVTPDATDFLNDNIFDADRASIEQPLVNTYEFRHTTPEVIDPTTSTVCPERSVRLILNVRRPAQSGTGSNLTVCTTDDLSALTNFDLNSLLEDEDVNGTWSETPETNQLSDLSDNMVDVEDIRNTNGHGTYTFIYTVFPEYRICEESDTAVSIIIQPKLQGTMEAANYCSGPVRYEIDLTPTMIPV